MRLIARDPRPAGLWLSSRRKRTTRPDLLQYFQASVNWLTGRLPQAVQACSLLAHNHGVATSGPFIARRSYSRTRQSRRITQQKDRDLEHARTSPGGRTSRSAFLTGPLSSPWGRMASRVGTFRTTECWPLRLPRRPPSGKPDCSIALCAR